MTPTDAFVACFLALDGSATFLLHERMRLRAVRLTSGERLYDPASVERCKAAMNGGPK